MNAVQPIIGSVAGSGASGGGFPALAAPLSP